MAHERMHQHVNADETGKEFALLPSRNKYTAAAAILELDHIEIRYMLFGTSGCAMENGFREERDE